MHLKFLLSPRPPRFPLRPPLALRLGGVLIAPHANLPPPHRLGILGAVRALGLAFEEGGGALLGAEGFRGAVRQVAGDGFFGAADGHFVERVLSEEGFARRLRDVAAHLVQMRFAEERALGVGARAHVVERGFLEEGFCRGFAGRGIPLCPAGHLALKGGDRLVLGAGFPLSAPGLGLRRALSTPPCAFGA